MVLTFLVRNQTLTYLDTKLVPRIGSAEYLQLKFKFITSDWVNLRKTIQISSGEYSESYILESDIFDVPTYYTQQGSFDITFLGDRGSQVVPTNVVTVKLSESNRLWTAEPPDPQNSAYLQLIGSVGNLADLETVSKDNLVDAINEGKHTADSKQDTLIQSGANVGQIVKISDVDDTGKPTAWEAINIPEQVQTDWNQNDNTQPDYVKNRPFYSVTGTVTVENASDDALEGFPVFAVGDTVTVNVDGVEYSLVAFDDEGDPTIGDTSVSVGTAEEQFGWCIYFDGSDVWFYAKEAHTVSYFVEEEVKIDEKYLPPISKQVVYNLSNAAFKDTAGGSSTYYFVDPTTLTEILKSINTGSLMPYVGFKVRQSGMGNAVFYANYGIDLTWGTSMDARAVTVYGKTAISSLTAYIFDTFEHAKEYYER